VYAAVNRGDLESMARSFEPGFEWHPDELSPAQRPRESAAEAIDTVRDFTSPFREFETAVTAIETRGDHVIADVHHRGKVGAGAVDRRETHLWTFREGSAVSLREFETHQEAVSFLEGAASE